MIFFCVWSSEQSWNSYLKENRYPELDASWFYSVHPRQLRGNTVNYILLWYVIPGK